MSDKPPLVSIIMPVYNSERYLKAAVDSVLRQTYTNFELIIVDDGSTDDSWSIISHYANIDGRIRAVHQENKGVVAASNHGASLAKGTFISRHDSDDISFENKLDDLIRVANENPNAIVITGNIEVINEAGEYLYRELVPVYSDDIKRALYYRNPLPNGATMIKTSSFQAVGGYEDVFAEDCHLWTKLYDKGDFAGTGTTIYRWRMNSTGLTLSNNTKSIEKEKEYTAIIWSLSIPSFVTRKDVLRQCNTYLSISDRFGVDYKKIYLYDLARLSIQLVKRGYIRHGLFQILIICSTGRTGLKISLERIGAVISGHKDKIFRTIRPHTQGSEINDTID